MPHNYHKFSNYWEGTAGHCSILSLDINLRKTQPLLQMHTHHVCYSAMILASPALTSCLLVSVAVCDVLLLVVFLVSVGSPAATGRADVVIDNWPASTAEDFECVVILSRWRPALEVFSLPLRKEGKGRKAVMVGCPFTLCYHAVSLRDLTSEFIKRKHMVVWFYLFVFLWSSQWAFFKNSGHVTHYFWCYLQNCK